MPDVTLEIVEATPVVLELSGNMARSRHNRSGCIMISPSISGAPTLTTGTSKAVVRVASDLNGLILAEVGAGVTEVSSSGAVTVQMRRVRNGVSVNMLTTVITIDQGEYDSTTATAPVINTANDDVLTGDQIHFDVLTAGANVRGLVVSFTFQPIA